MAEVLVHVSINNLPDDFLMLTIYLPDSLPVRTITEKELPDYWQKTIPLEGTQKIGDQFINQNDYIALKVPSAVVPGDHNILIHPNHPEIHQIKIIDEVLFPFDERLFK